MGERSSRPRCSWLRSAPAALKVVAQYLSRFASAKLTFTDLPKLSELTDPDLPLELARQLKRKHSEPPRRFTTRSRSRSPGRPQASGSK